MKVAILGDGIVSLTLAKALVNRGINVHIISDNKKKIINKSQTIGITQSNLEFFNKKILNINSLSWKIKNIEIFTEKLANQKILDFNNNKKTLFSIVKNYQLYNLLNNNLKKNKNFKRKKKLLNNNNYQIIVNCDHNSSVTKKIFYKKIEKSYQSFAYITCIKHKKISNNNTAIQIFSNFGPIAFLPISRTETSIVYSIKKNINITQDKILNLISKYNSRYSIVKINKIQNFNLILSNLRVYHHKNILAFGDLLHKIHPLAGQGFNMTIRDIKQLLKIVNSRIDLGLEINSTVCLEFEKLTKHKNYLFTSGIDFVYELFNFESKIKGKNLSKVIQFLGKNKSLNKFFTKFANEGRII